MEAPRPGIRGPWRAVGRAHWQWDTKPTRKDVIERFFDEWPAEAAALLDDACCDDRRQAVISDLAWEVAKVAPWEMKEVYGFDDEGRLALYPCPKRSYSNWLRELKEYLLTWEGPDHRQEAVGATAGPLEVVPA